MLEKVVVNIDSNEFSVGITYIDCSSVRKLIDLLFDSSFNFKNLLKIKSKKPLIPKDLVL